MNYCKNINSIEKLNLERIIDNICEEYRNRNFVKAMNLSQKGLAVAGKTMNVSWVRMFDALYKEMIDTYNSLKVSENMSKNSKNKSHVIVPRSTQELKIKLY